MTLNLQSAKQVFSGGVWATQRMQAAYSAGRPLSFQELRTLDSLPHEAWIDFDDVVLEEAVIRLNGVAHLIEAGLVRPVENALGKTLLGYDRATDMDPAITSLSGLAQTDYDTIEIDDAFIPLPITHKDFYLDIRRLESSRNSGEGLDTTKLRISARLVSEQLEQLLFNGGNTYGGNPIHGYTTHPDRNTSGFDGTKEWGDGTKAGSSFLADVSAIKQALIDDRQSGGPIWIYADTSAETNLDADFKADSDLTIRERLLKVEGIDRIVISDTLAADNVIGVKATPDVVQWALGEDIQTVQWDAFGGFRINFKVMAIQVPLIRSTQAGRSGIVHLS